MWELRNSITRRIKINNKLFFRRKEFSVKCTYSTKVTFAPLANMKQGFFLFVSRQEHGLNQLCNNVVLLVALIRKPLGWNGILDHNMGEKNITTFSALSLNLHCLYSTRYYIHPSHCTLPELFALLPPDNTNVVFCSLFQVQCWAMLGKLICLWTLCVLSSVLLEGEGSPVLKGRANAIKGNVELNMTRFHYWTTSSRMFTGFRLPI